MRYKAYYTKEPMVMYQPGDKMENYELVDEDDDLQVLQSRLHEKIVKEGREYLMHIKLVDTHYEEKFNKMQDEIRNQLS